MITALDKQTALVLIDLQTGIVGMNLTQPAATVVSNSAKLVSAFRKENLPIIFVTVNPFGSAWIGTRTENPGLPSAPEAQRQALEAMTASGFFNLVPELGVTPEDIHVVKNTWSAFPSTSLHDLLQTRGVTGIVLAGISTSIGVEGTARDASVKGYNITFVKDAMADTIKDAEEHSLKNIFPRIGELDDTDSIISYLSRRK